MTSNDDLLAAIANQAELTKIELRAETAEAIAAGIQVQSDRPTIERGGTEIVYGDVVGVGDGYVSVQFPDQTDPLPVASNIALSIGDRVTVARTPSTAVVIGSGTGAVSTPTPETPPPAVVNTGRSWQYEQIVRQSDGLALASFNGGGFAQDYTLTDVDGTEYCLFYAPDLTGQLARKPLGGLNWEVKNLSFITGNPLAFPVVLDGHFFMTFGIDGDGVIWVAGNMHAGPLRCARTTVGVNDPSFDFQNGWTGDNMNGTVGAQVTYPMFHRLPNGRFIFFRREGTSGDGDQVCGYRDPGGIWHNFNQITDGTIDNVSAYLLPPVVGLTGDTLHILFDWRISSNANTNNGWYYFALRGLLAGTTLTAEKTDGTPITLPIRLGGDLGGTATADRWAEKIADVPGAAVSDPTAPGSALNDAAPGGFQPCDRAGYPHSSFMSIDIVGNPNHYHLFRDVDGWHMDQITTFGPWVPPANWSGNTPAGDASRMKIVNTPDGQVLAIGHWPAEGRRGGLWCHDLTTRNAAHGFTAWPGGQTADGIGTLLQPSGGWINTSLNQPFKLHGFEDQGDFHYNFESLVGVQNQTSLPGNQLKILITGSSQRYYHDPAAHGYSDNPTAGSGWGTPTLQDPAAILGLWTCDLTQLDKFKNREVVLARIKPVKSSSGNDIIVPANTDGFTRAEDLLAYTGHRSSVNISGTNYFVWNDEASGRPYGNEGQGAAPQVVIGVPYSGADLYARMTIMMQLENASGVPVSMNSGWVGACIIAGVAMQSSPSHEQTPVGLTSLLAACWNDSTGGTPGGSNVSQSNYAPTTVLTTSWASLRAFMAQPGGIGGFFGQLRIAARSGGNPSGVRARIVRVDLELGQLDA